MLLTSELSLEPLQSFECGEIARDGPNSDAGNNKRQTQSAEDMEASAESQHQIADGPFSDTGSWKDWGPARKEK